MTNSYYDDQYDQYEDDYVDDEIVDAQQNQFYAQEATFSPRSDVDVWPQRTLSRLLGSMLWGVALFGVVAGTIWYCDILPTSFPEKPFVVADDPLKRNEDHTQKRQPHQSVLKGFLYRIRLKKMINKTT